MLEKHRIRIAAALCLAALGISAHSQTARGTIQGTVYDPSQAVVGEAHVTLTEQQTDQTGPDTAGASGFFQFRALPLGVYTLEIEQAGFAKEVIKDIPLQVAETRTMNVMLRMLTLGQCVTVQSRGPLPQVADTSASPVIDEQRIAELPLNGLNMLQLASLSAGVVNSAKGSLTIPTCIRGTPPKPVRSPARVIMNTRKRKETIFNRTSGTNWRTRVL